MSRKLTVGFACLEYPTSENSLVAGGIGTYVKIASRWFAERGHRVHVVTSKRRDLPRDWEEGLAQIHQVDLDPPNIREPQQIMAYSRAVADKLGELHENEQLDVVHFSEWAAEGWAYRPPGETVLSVAIHVIWDHEHGDGTPIEWQVSELERVAVERADLLTTPSRMMVEKLAQRWSFDVDSAIRIPQPMDLGAFGSTPEPADSDSEPVVLAVNRLTPFKGPDVLVRAAALVHRTHPRAKFRFIGRAGDWNGTPADVWLRDLATSEGLPLDRLELAGARRREELPEELSRATVCVNPSVAESYSYTSAEALAGGRALVLTSGQGIVEELRAGVDCLVVPPRNAEALAQAIRRLLDDPALRGRIAASGRKAAEERIGSSISMARLESAFFDAKQKVEDRPRIKPELINVAILTYNALDHTKTCLARLIEDTSVPMNIFVLDNNSSDGTQAWLSTQKSENVHIHLNDTNLGVPGGRNKLFEIILPSLPDDGVIAFLDNDVVVEKGWWKPYLDVFENHEGVGIAGAMGHPMLVKGDVRELYPSPDQTGPVDVVSGFSFWVKAQAAWEIGRFDEKLGLFWHEDDDYCVRAQQLGYGVYVVPNHLLVHNEHQSGFAEGSVAEQGSLRNQRYLVKKWRDCGWIDESGHVIRRDAVIDCSREARSTIERTLGRVGEVPEEEWIESADFLERMVQDPDIEASFARNRAPLAPTLLKLLEWNVERFRNKGQQERENRLRLVRDVLNRDSYSGYLRRVLCLPQPPSDTPRTEGRISKICSAADWDDPEWLEVGLKALGSDVGNNYYRRHRQAWEYVQLIYGLGQLGVLGEDSRGLSVAAGQEPLMFHLANRVQMMVAVDLYDVESQENFGVDPDFPDHPEAYAPWEYRRDHLKVMRMDARRLQFADERFDFVYSASSLPHLGMRKGALAAMREMARVVKPGGVVAFSTDILLNRHPDIDRFSIDDLISELIEPSGLRLVEGIDFSTGDDTLEGFSDCPENSGRLPHFVHQNGESIMTSAVVFLERAPAVQNLRASDQQIPTDHSIERVDAAPNLRVDGRRPRIGIDVRNFEVAASGVLSTGFRESLAHLAAVIDGAPEWDFVFFGEESLPAPLANFSASANVRFEPIDEYTPGVVDLVHLPQVMKISLGFDSPFRVFRESKKTAMIHDLLPLRVYWDDWPKDCQEVYRSRFDQLSSTNVVVLTPSEFVRNDVIRATDLNPTRVKTISSGISRGKPTNLTDEQAAEIKRKIGVTEPYFLHVGDLDPHKNFDTALLAFKEVFESQPCQLVVVGRNEGVLKAYKDMCRSKRVAHIVFPGFLPRAALDILYRDAIALLRLSRYEAFGTVALEAVAQGCPVIASETTSIPELIGNAGVFVSPTDTAMIRKAMGELLRNPHVRRDLGNCGPEQSSRFTWEATAARTLSIWRDLLTESDGVRSGGVKQEMSGIPQRSRGGDSVRASQPTLGPCPPSLTPTPVAPSKSGEIVGIAGGCAPSAMPQKSRPATSRSDREQVIVWNAPLLDLSGYADEARQFVLGLDEAGHRVRGVPFNWNHDKASLRSEDRVRLDRLMKTTIVPGEKVVNVFHIFPQHFKRDGLSVLSIGRTTFETDRIPQRWVNACNAMDEIWVPSEFNVKTFRASGVDRVRKIPAALDTDLYSRPVDPLMISERKGFNFLSLFDWTLRKGWDVLLRAYVEEFDEHDDVALILKVGSSLGFSQERVNMMVQSFVENHLGRDPVRIPDVVVLQQKLTQELMPGLFRAADCYVMPSRGEGWGRPYMEAMAMGLPVIGTGWGGNTEFMNEDNSYLIESELVEIPEEAVREAPHFHGHRWAEPSVRHLRELMRGAFENREEGRRRGALAREEILETYSRRQVAKTVTDRVHELLERHRAPTVLG